MPRDYGDPFPSDAGDVKPGSPTTGFNELRTRRVGKRSPRLKPEDTGFSENIGVQQPFPKIKYSWEGTILSSLGNNYFEVLLQNGNVVTARDIYYLPGYSFAVAQSVGVFKGQRPGEFFLFGQKFKETPAIQWCKLQEELVISGSANGFIIDNQGNVTTDEIEIHDIQNLNYGLPDELFPFIYNVQLQRADIVGSNGLTRLGKSTEAITAGGSGTIQIHNSTGAVSGATLISHLIWAHSGSNLPTEKEVIIQFFPDFAKWIIIGREC